MRVRITDTCCLAGNFPVLPLRTRTRGPAYTLPALPSDVPDTDVPPDNESYDCIDEILSLFRANVLFRNFEINGPADRMLIYGTLFVSDCLGKVKPSMGARDAEKALINVAFDHFAIPGDVSFPFNQAFEPPRDRQDAETLRAYVIAVDCQKSQPLTSFADSFLRYDRRLPFGCMRDYTPVVLGPRR